MISRFTGEVTFQDLRILPQAALVSAEAGRAQSLPVAGWLHHVLGIHHSDRGAFEVEVVLDAQRRIRIVLLAHSHPFYLADTPEDAERRAFQEGIISSDLAGQREFSWGQVVCRIDKKANKDWLVVAYTIGPKVPMQTDEVLRHFYAHDPEPTNG